MSQFFDKWNVISHEVLSSENQPLAGIWTLLFYLELSIISTSKLGLAPSSVSLTYICKNLTILFSKQKKLYPRKSLFPFKNSLLIYHWHIKGNHYLLFSSIKQKPDEKQLAATIKSWEQALFSGILNNNISWYYTSCDFIAITWMI